MLHLDGVGARVRAAVCVIGAGCLVHSALAGPDPAGADRHDVLGSGGLAFSEAVDATGLVHEHRTTPGLLLIAALHAAGAAAGDFNGDGLHDLFVLGGGLNADRMFINNGDGTFTDMAPAWGMDRRHHAYGASAADFDGDGDLDIFISSYGPSNNVPLRWKYLLLRNDAVPGTDDRVFTDIATSAGLNGFLTSFVDGTGSGWGDYDLDGRLDLMVCGYRNQHAGNRLYRNLGPDQDGVWKFQDVTAAAGVQSTAVQGFLPRFVDMTGDRYPELLLIADTGSTRYYVNNRDGTFTLRNDLAFRVSGANAMGVDVGDVDNDGLLDWYITNITEQGNGNLMLVQNPDGSYTDRAAQMGVFEGYWGWGALIVDIDHNGHPDIIETNGGIGQFTNKPSLLYLNEGDGVSFAERGVELGFSHFGQGRGMIRMDFENDGDLDLVIVCNNQPMAVFRNDLIGPDGVTPPDANWLRVILDTSARGALAPQGIGSMVRTRSAQGERLIPLDNASNHCTTAPAEAHFGLGADTAVDALQIAWADGSYTTLADVPANQILRVSAPAHPADFDGSGEVDMFDLSAFVQALGAGSATADANGDWRIDFFDLARFVRQFREGM
jgi:hypothetical protein